MMLLPTSLGLLIFAATSSAFAIQLPFQQPGSSSPLDWPYRALEWGQVNIVSTTDTHGWLLGHQRQEASFSGDWGDLYSFVNKMKAEARRRGVDLLLVDSGDRVDGNGLVDGEPAGHPKGYTAMQYFQEMPYDVITTGNHELYNYPVALSTYENLAQHYGDNYITSNVNITIGTEDGGEESVPSGKRFRKFETEMGRKVTALGPLFFFKAHAKGVDVQPPNEMIKESWFLEAIAEQPDFFLLVGHMSVTQTEEDSQWKDIFTAIRSVHPYVPILIFGGHHHIRDCVQEDSRSMSLASGRYMETVGWMSVSGLDGPLEEPLTFSRRYLDQNRNTYIYHAGAGFDTDKGLAMSKEMGVVAGGFNLTKAFGVAPQSYYLSRHSHQSSKSILNLMTSKVLPLLIKRPDRPNKAVTILNSGSIRFNIFKGPFTRNDQYIADVPLSIASLLLPYLNLVGEHGVLPSSFSSSGLSSSIEQIYQRSLANSYASFTSASQFASKKLSLGYVTIDSCPGLGDDTLHQPFPSVWQPTFVQTEMPKARKGKGRKDGKWKMEGPEEKVDIVFFDFIQPDVLAALNYVQGEKTFGKEDVGLYLEGLTANTVMQEYAERAWS
ncbi:hypothetical protein P7C70_g4988, partial [Phenoliferia sp. Uapishka_3]